LFDHQWHTAPVLGQPLRASYEGWVLLRTSASEPSPVLIKPLQFANSRLRHSYLLSTCTYKSVLQPSAAESMALRTNTQERSSARGSAGRSVVAVANASVSAVPTLDAWTSRWNHFKDRTKEVRWELATGMPNKDVLRLHKDLHKAESSALIQFRTGRTGLNRFLASMRVPDIEPQCRCGFVRETPRHVLFDCELENHRRRPWRRTNLQDFILCLSDPKTAAKAARWIVGIERLSQFQLAHELLPLRTNLF
jgi:hypothetical protein